MSKALLWKEWRQLALVRWGGIALGALLPVAFTTGAELAKRGLLPTGNVKEYSPRDLMFELLPAALALGLWPLIALMAAAQAFAADRAAGTETFLLERPVPRDAVWRARLVASLGTLGVVIVATAALGAIVAAIAGVPPAIGWTRWLQWSGAGVGVALLAFLGGLLASSLLASPMGAVLAGAVLAGVPVLAAAQLTAVFPHARYGPVPLGAVLPALMLPAYVVASWSSSCRGEPAGRGRVRRGVAIGAGSLATVLLLFVSAAPVLVRANAAGGMHGAAPSPSGRTVFVGASSSWGDGGWIVEVVSGRKLAFVPPPVQQVAWSPDGSELAVVTWSGSLGGQRRDARIDVYGARDGRVLRSLALPRDRLVSALAWARDGLVVIDPRSDSLSKDRCSVDIIDARNGMWRSTGYRSETWGTLDGPRDDGRIFLRIPLFEEGSNDRKSLRGYQLRPIDVLAGSVGAAVADASGASLRLGGWGAGLSPTGRFATVLGGDAERGRLRLRDIEGGTDLSLPAFPTSARWLSGDRLVWHDDLEHRSRLLTTVPGSGTTAVREWTDAQVGFVSDPSGRSLFVSVLPVGGPPSVDSAIPPPDPSLFTGEAPAGPVPEEAVFLSEEARWIDLPVFSGRLNDERYTMWAGPKTLARIAPGVVYFEDVDKPGAKRFVLGGEADLR